MNIQSTEALKPDLYEFYSAALTQLTIGNEHLHLKIAAQKQTNVASTQVLHK